MRIPAWRAWLILLGATVVMVIVVIPYRGRP